MELNYKSISYKSFQSKMFDWLFKGICLTFLTALLMNISGIIDILQIAFLPLTIICSIIEIILVIVLAKKVESLTIDKAKFYFYLYSVVNGITLSLLLYMVHPMISVITFIISAAYFKILQAVSDHSKSDFIQLGHICISALPLLIIAYIILMFIHIPIIYYLVIVIDLIIFSGLTLFDLKNALRLYNECDDTNIECAALISALQLYLDFINIFIDILMIVADN